MPRRRKPYTTALRFNAVKTGKEHKDMIPTPLVIPYKTSTINALDAFYPPYKVKIDALDVLLLQQVSLTAQMKIQRPKTEMLISHFYEAMQNAVKRELFLPEVRTVYGLDANNGKLPVMDSDAAISYWGGKAIAGETARMAIPGAVPITFPSIAEVSAAVTAFDNLNLQQGEAKTAFDLGQEGIAADAIIADELILRMWNETEAEFDKGDKPSMRRKSREWGVVYVPTPGEAPSPEDFSIMGATTEVGTGNPLADVEVKVMQNGNVYTSNEDGEFFVPVLADGIYDIEFKKTNYVIKLVNNVVITAGVITELNVELEPVVALGTISGNVKEAGMNKPGVNIMVNGFPLLTAVTDINGNFTINNVPAGAQTLTAKLPPPSPAMPQTQPVMVLAGAEVNVSFMF